MAVERKTNASIINHFNENLKLEVKLPKNFSVLNPYELKETRKTARQFFNHFFNDQEKRRLILGINPGRLGAGYTGIPFTDPKHVKKLLGIEMTHMMHEPSSVFVYEMIEAMGGPDQFYKEFYISSVCPLGFTTVSEKGRVVNRNYYDEPQLLQNIKPFVVKSLEEQKAFLSFNKVFILGTSQNFKFFKQLNDEINMFEQVVPLPHPRFIMQYRLKKKEEFIELYCKELS